MFTGKNIKTFCLDHNMSRFSYNRMRDAGWGPVESRRPGSSKVVITPQAEADWLKLIAGRKAQGSSSASKNADLSKPQSPAGSRPRRWRVKDLAGRDLPMRERFVEHNFQKASLTMIEQVNAILNEYQAQGFTLILRQLYYQFVARGLIENTKQRYAALGWAVANGRDAGLIDWSMIEDRSRELRGYLTFDDPADSLTRAAETYAEDLWLDQPHHVELWVEKDALAGVFERVCNEYRVPLLAHRGNNSVSLMYEAGKRFAEKIELGRKPVVLHLADHDPSGLDMTRDTIKRLARYAGKPIEVRRMALNIDQVRHYRPPNNFAKETDPKYPKYRAEFGPLCSELDALSPDVLDRLARDAIVGLIDRRKWNRAREREQDNRELIEEIAEDHR